MSRLGLGALATVASFTTLLSACGMSGPGSQQGTQPVGSNTNSNALTFEAPSGPLEVRAGSTLHATVSAHRSDGHPVMLSVQELPSNASYHPMTGELVFSPAYDQLGSFPFAFIDSSGASPGQLVLEVKPLAWAALEQGVVSPDSSNGIVIVDAKGSRILFFGSNGGLWARDFPAATGAAFQAISVQGVGPTAVSTVLLEPSGARAVAISPDATEAFVLDLSTWMWTALGGEAPPARTRYAAALDDTQGLVYVFGGLDDRGPRNDLWTLDLAGGWTLLHPAGPAPQHRAGAVATFDTPRDRLMLVGGDASFSPATPDRLRDVWALVLNASRPTWELIEPAGPPPPARADFVGCHDTSNARLFAWGGIAGAKTAMDEPWELRLGDVDEWRRVEVEGETPEPVSSQATYDQVNSRVVLIASPADDAGTLDVWELRL